MAVITSQATGLFSAGATWAGGVPPAAGDSFVIANTHNVTLDGVLGGAGFVGGTVQNGGTLTVPVAATTGLIFTGDGTFTVDVGGTLTMAGGAALAAANTFTMTATPAADGGFGFVFNGTAVIKGAPKDHMRLLAADCGEWAAAGDVATVGNVPQLTLDAIPSGWRDHDIIARAPTGRIYTHWDTCRLNGAPAAAVIDVEGWQGAAPTYDAGVGTKSSWNAQGAGTPAQARAEVLNLSRNVRVFSSDPTKRTYITIGATATVTMDYVECYSIGINAPGKYGITIATTTGDCHMTGLVAHDSNRYAYVVYAVTTGTVNLDSCIGWTTAFYGLSLGGFVGTAALDACIMGNAASYGFNIADVGSTFATCRAVGNASDGFNLSENEFFAAGSLDGIVTHSNAGLGLNIRFAANTAATPISGTIIWRNYGGASYLYPSGSGASQILQSAMVFGNRNIALFQFGGPVRYISPILIPDIAAYTGAVSIHNVYGALCEVLGGSLDVAASIAGSRILANGVTWTNFAAPTFQARDVGLVSHLLSFRHNATPDDHRMYYAYGSVLSNAVTRHTASGLSWQHLPSGGAAVWFRPNIPHRLNCPPNILVTASAWVYVDAAYNGTAKPRIVVLGGHLQGIPADVIGDSHSGALGWERLTVQATATEQGRLPYVIEGQGNAGSFYVDDVRLEW